MLFGYGQFAGYFRGWVSMTVQRSVIFIPPPCSTPFIRYAERPY